MKNGTSLKRRMRMALQGKYKSNARPRSTKDIEIFTSSVLYEGRTKIIKGGKMDGILKSVYGLYLDLIDEKHDSAAREARHIFEALVKVERESFEDVHLAFVVSNDWTYAPIVPKTPQEIDRAPRGGW